MWKIFNLKLLEVKQVTRTLRTDIKKKVNKMSPTKRVRKNSSDLISPNKIYPCSNKNPLKKFCAILSPSKSNSNSPSKNGKNLCKLEDYESMFANEDSFDLIENFDKENTELNSPIKSSQSPEKLDLSNWQRCRLINSQIDPKTIDLIITVKNDMTKASATCRLQGFWSKSKICNNEIISIIASWSNDLQCFVVNKDSGFFVTNPDFLVSGTSVVGSLFCKRKAAFQDKFRGIDSNNKIMVVGSIVHELFQMVLLKKLDSLKSIKKAVDELLNSQEMAFQLYSSNLTLNEAIAETDKFIPHILGFVKQYIQGKSEIDIKNAYQGRIETIQDIEENLWVPKLGLKGKVDVTVKIHRQNKFSSNKLMPLELKTGKSSFSLEHKGQVILYQMMLSELGKKTDSGLLLYLRDGIMKEIPATRNEQRDLIMLRNDLAYYLTRNMNYIEVKNDLNESNFQFEDLELPEPINHLNACSKCPYNTICTSFLFNNSTTKLSEKHPLQKIGKECTKHLTQNDFQYFQHWCGILSLETVEIKKSNHTSALWLESAAERAERGKAIINLAINGKVEFKDNKFIHNFIVVDDEKHQINDAQFDLTLTGVSIGDYIAVSSLGRIAIAAGHIVDLQKNSITVSLERDLLQNYSNEKFIIDKYESQSSMVFNYTNLGILLDNTDISNRLRSIVVNKIPATFTNQLPNIVKKAGHSIFAQLNSGQKSALLKALTTNNYMLIKGLPGTGKTQTLVSIVRMLYILGKSVLITSHTHSAVDNLLIRLKQFDLPFLRLGAENRIHPELSNYSEAATLRNIQDPDELAMKYSSFNIIGVTCLGSGHSLFSHRKFDVCIIDEATQVYQPTVLRPLFYADKFILVGDPDQLPPLVRSTKARQFGGDESLFNRLDCPASTSTLTLQYRMNKTITKLANDLTYNNELVCANADVSSACLQLPKHDILIRSCTKEKWILRALAKHIDQSVMLINTQNSLNQNIQFGELFNQNLDQIITRDQQVHEKIDTNRKYQYVNYCEAAVILVLLKSLIIAGHTADKIGIMAPYRSQVELLKKLYHEPLNDLNFEKIEINTVDQYQGRDKEIILYSCTKSGIYDAVAATNNKHELNYNEILEDRRRLTVAITRSKHKLILVGDELCLMRYKTFQDLFTKIPERCKVILEDNKMGFSWNDTLKSLQEIIR